MAVPTQKTYFAAPNFDFAPDELIKLGQIISDHKAPGKAICEPHQPLPKVHSSHFDDWEKERTRSFNGSIGIFSQFLALLLGLGGDVSTSFAKDTTTIFKFRKLETFFIEPSKSYVEGSMRVAAVQEYLREHPKTHSLFMITGTKNARGAECTKKLNRGGDIEGNISVDLTNATGVPVSVGPKGSLARREDDMETFAGSSDFVFAYRLCRISVRKKTGTFTSEDYTKGATYAEGLVAREDDGESASRTVETHGGTAAQTEIGTEFEFGGEEDDFASTFVPPGYKAVSVVDENGKQSRLIFER